MPLILPRIEDRGMLARYPFLPQGSEFIKGILEENGISIEELIDAPWLEDVRIRGRVRLVDSVLQDGGIEEASTIDISTEIGRMTEALSFLHAMLVVCASFDERLLARWIEGEASRADRLLGIDSESFPEISGSYLSDIRADGNGTRDVEFWVPLADFIELCPRISGNYWRLVNRPVRDGWVCLDAGVGESSRERTARLIKERIREHLHRSCLDRMERMDDEFAARFSEPVERITGLLSERVEAEMPMTAAIREDWPPCFESAVSELNQGVNVNHVGRVFIAAFSSALGLAREQACNFFANAPDYEVETTSYQVSQIYERGYTPHGCSALKTNARCPVQLGDDSLCDQEWMTHPLKYIRAKQRRRFQDSSNPEARVVEGEGSDSANSS
jgi:DNA primase large subunit|tara:strand:- start:3567 stop:4730 length:1164 start_codon:yes stop_codon:yes gene_type:complete